MSDFGSLHWIAAALWIFWVGVDQRAWGGLQIHQPAVAGAITGVLAGIPWIGVLFGAALQCLWIRPLPVGGNIPPASGLAACTGVLWLRMTLARVGEPNSGEGLTAWLLLAALSLATAWGGIQAETWVRKWNARLEDSGMKRLDSWKAPMAARTMAGIALAGIAACATVGAALLLGFLLWTILLGSPDRSLFTISPVRKIFALVWVLLGFGLGGEIARLGRESWKDLGWVGLGVLVGAILGRLSP